jgi:hypothetical protein
MILLSNTRNKIADRKLVDERCAKKDMKGKRWKRIK